MSSNVSLLVANVDHFKSVIMIIVVRSAKIQKNRMCAKEVIFAILLHIFVKMINI